MLLYYKKYNNLTFFIQTERVTAPSLTHSDSDSRITQSASLRSAIDCLHGPMTMLEGVLHKIINYKCYIIFIPPPPISPSLIFKMCFVPFQVLRMHNNRSHFHFYN